MLVRGPGLPHELQENPCSRFWALRTGHWAQRCNYCAFMYLQGNTPCLCLPLAPDAPNSPIPSVAPLQNTPNLGNAPKCQQHPKNLKASKLFRNSSNLNTPQTSRIFRTPANASGYVKISSAPVALTTPTKLQALQRTAQSAKSSKSHTRLRIRDRRKSKTQRFLKSLAHQALRNFQALHLCQFYKALQRSQIRDFFQTRRTPRTLRMAQQFQTLRCVQTLPALYMLWML